MKKTVALFILLSASYFISAQNGFLKSILKEDSIVSNHSLFCILDSINEIQSNKTFKFYDNDNHLQIEGDYAVLSYRIRGKIEFYSGRIYRSGKLLINDSNSYYALAFQSDNQFDATNQGVNGILLPIGFTKTQNVKYYYVQILLFLIGKSGLIWPMK
jgi:hypothetical protein